jgi:hypothetical protein
MLNNCSGGKRLAFDWKKERLQSRALELLLEKYIPAVASVPLANHVQQRQLVPNYPPEKLHLNCTTTFD